MERAIRHDAQARGGHRTASFHGSETQEEPMFDRDRDTRRDDERDVDVQDQDRGSTEGGKRTGSRNTGGGNRPSGTGGRSGSSGQKKK
ncbi:MAG TPA: hypothetical protein VFP58_11750 [Candidatus Eisenbacteria bacterium]|nr:hypothetical protein [Candidatus Eisenbacteria bacterium]